MATLQQVITRADEDKTNAYDEVKKTLWINTINKLIHTEVKKSREEYQELTYPDSQDVDLIVPTPYDNVYDYYIYAMIDLLNTDFASYNNYMQVYNTAYNEYAKHYLRNNMPEQIQITNVK